MLWILIAGRHAQNLEKTMASEDAIRRDGLHSQAALPRLKVTVHPFATVPVIVFITKQRTYTKWTVFLNLIVHISGYWEIRI
jgi:hypothetical protein